jgi:hypothetical protein
MAVAITLNIETPTFVRMGGVESGSVAAYGFISDKLKGGFPDEFCHD